MNGAFLFDAMGGIRQAYVEEAEKQAFSMPHWKRVLPLAACMAVVLGLAAVGLILAGLPVPGIPALAGPEENLVPQLRQYADQLAVLSDPMAALAVGGILLLLGIWMGRLTAAGKLHWGCPGLDKFVMVLGLQILLLLPCVSLWDLQGIGNAFFRLGVGLIRGFSLLVPLVGFLWVYIYDLQKFNGKKASWGYPLGVAVFPVLYVLVAGRMEDVVWQTLLSAYYVPSLMTSLLSTIVLKLQKGERHGRE